MSENRANIEITATSNRLNSGLRAAATKMGRWEAEIMQTSKRSGSATAAAFAGNFAANLASRGLDIAADQARAALDFDRQLVDLQIATGKTRGEMSAIADAARAVSSAVGLSSAEVLAGAQRYVAITGDVDGATTAMSSFARIARAAGAPVEDVSKAAAALRDNLNLDPSQFEAAFGGLIAQGKAGSVEVKDLAAELASLAPQFAQFKGAGGLGSVGELGAAFQIAKKGFGDANTAATGLKSMMTALTQNADRFAKAGIRVYDKDPKTGVKTLRNFSEIWADINKSKLVNDPTALGKAFGREEATRTFRMFQQYPALFEQLIAAGKEFGTVQQDLATRLESTSGRVDRFTETAKNNMQRSAEFLAGGVEGFGEAIFGETEETKQSRANSKRLDDRWQMAEMQILAQRPGLASDPEVLRAMAQRQVGKENMLQEALARGHRVAPAYQAPQFREVDHRLKTGEVVKRYEQIAPERSIAVEEGYTVEELRGMYQDIQGSTNEAMLAKLIEQQLAEMKKQTDVMKTMASQGTVLKTDSETIAKASGKSTSPRRSK